MKQLTAKIARFFERHKQFGVPQLMLFIAIGNVLVFFLTRLNPDNPLFYNILCFDRDLVLRGQVWRLLTYAFVYLTDQSPIWGLISLVFYVFLGRQLEVIWGRLRFDVYYLTGLLLTSLAGLALGGDAVYRVSVQYLNLSLVLAYASLLPDNRIMFWGLLPLKMKIFAWIELGFQLFAIVQGLVVMVLYLPGTLVLDWLMPIIALGNYLIYFGKNIKWLLPDRWQQGLRKKQTAKKYPDWVRGGGGGAKKNYRFKCTVCGRTDVSNPGLEFRYCSKCSGYRCYCVDHINSHPHIIDGGQGDA